MDKELLTKLMEAGLPQYPQYVGLHNQREMEESMDKCIVKSGGIVQPRTPSLEELIEACGDEFYSLTKTIKNEWRAENDNGLGERPDLGFGKTPQEAVAKLWLELNKK